jgi:hypothetical protein
MTLAAAINPATNHHHTLLPRGHRMGPLDAIWHVLNLFGPAIGLGLIAPTLAKLLWRNELRAVAWATLVRWVAGGGALVIVAGLLLFGRDGKMLTYAALVLSAALLLWWRGWRARPAGR